MTNLTWRFDPESNPNPKKELPEKEDISSLYLGGMMSTRALAKHYGVSQPQIRRWLIELKIPIRDRKHAASGKPPCGSENWNWKGDEVSYTALHAWVRRWKGTPRECEHCGTTKAKKYEWANVSGEYKRELSDWIRLCTKCHKIFDSKK